MPTAGPKAVGLSFPRPHRGTSLQGRGPARTAIRPGLTLCYAFAVTEFGLGILIMGGLLVIERDRLDWAAAKLRELFEWLSS